VNNDSIEINEHDLEEPRLEKGSLQTANHPRDKQYAIVYYCQLSIIYYSLFFVGQQ
jgi:hypothetical protein